MSWDESTESKFLSGESLSHAGLAVTLVSIAFDQMQERGAAEGKMETVFIGSFAEPGIKPWVINKTGRRFLKEQCGITNVNVHGFAPIALTLIRNETQMGTGIKPILRAVPDMSVVAAPAPIAQPVAAPVPVAQPVAAAVPAEPAHMSEEVPF